MHDKYFTDCCWFTGTHPIVCFHRPVKSEEVQDDPHKITGFSKRSGVGCQVSVLVYFQVRARNLEMPPWFFILPTPHPPCVETVSGSGIEAELLPPSLMLKRPKILVSPGMFGFKSRLRNSKVAGPSQKNSGCSSVQALFETTAF